ncbi:Nodulation protein W [Pararobbsia alpina]|uniref:response regulator transcription factor n=1 Tax=Pararobbsia alpina TaxID=621374 RepID=UPI0039A5D80E
MRVEHPTIGYEREIDVAEQACVYVVDDDERMRASISSLLRSVGVRVETFASARDFLAFKRTSGPSCLVLDVRLPNECGLEFQQQLSAIGLSMSIVFISGHGDIPMTVQAMRAGAIDFLSKPFRDQNLLDAVRNGLRQDRGRADTERTISVLRKRYESLTAKERKIMEFVHAGLLNKQIADRMHLSEITVKTHRALAMKKMGSRCIAEFVRAGEMLQLDPTHRFVLRPELV